MVEKELNLKPQNQPNMTKEKAFSRIYAIFFFNAAGLTLLITLIAGLDLYAIVYVFPFLLFLSVMTYSAFESKFLSTRETDFLGGGSTCGQLLLIIVGFVLFLPAWKFDKLRIKKRLLNPDLQHS